MKKQSLLFTLVTILTASCSLPQHTRHLDTILKDEEFDADSSYNYRCTMGAHRGASDKYVENTIEALKEANDSHKYGFIELDVQYSKDKRVVVYHDQRLIRQFGNLSAVGNTTFSELSRISKGEIAAYDEIIPLLDKRLNIEIKSQGDLDTDKQLVDEIIADIRSRKRESEVIISSISTDVIKYIKSKYPDMPTGQIFWITSSTYLHFNVLTQKLFSEINSTEADYLMLYVANLRNIENLLKLKPKGKTLVFWDFDDTMFIVHKDLSDQLWGDSPVTTLYRSLRYQLYSVF